jgi:D-glutamate N-acetyltransferase
VSDRLAIFAEGLFARHTGKTAHGVIRYGTREVVAVVDSTQAGRTAVEVEPFCGTPVPVVASVREAIDRGATTMLIGVAPTGGKLDAAWRPALREAIEAGLSLEAGLHTQLSGDPELAAAARQHGVTLRDLRASPPDLTVPKGPDSRPDGVRVVQSVGSDTVIGKKVVTLELDRAARERGLRSVYVPTGQTGVAIAGWGIAVDHVISDYVAGAAERLVLEGAERGDLLFVEGQGALFHPAYSGVTLGLLHGSAPDLLVLVHRPSSTAIRNYPDLPIPPLSELIAAYESITAPVRPARVVAIALNTGDLDEPEAQATVAAAEDETGLVTDDVVRFGAERVLDAVLRALPISPGRSPRLGA